jgi:hypothetical protein
MAHGPVMHWQGCNCALESVKVLVEAIDRVGLDAAPAAFTAARLRDAHALQRLELNQSVRLRALPSGACVDAEEQQYQKSLSWWLGKERLHTVALVIRETQVVLGSGRGSESSVLKGSACSSAISARRGMHIHVTAGAMNAIGKY